MMFTTVTLYLFRVNLQAKLYADSEPIEARAEAVVLLKQLNYPVCIFSFFSFFACQFWFHVAFSLPFLRTKLYNFAPPFTSPHLSRLPICSQWSLLCSHLTHNLFLVVLMITSDVCKKLQNSKSLEHTQDI